MRTTEYAAAFKTALAIGQRVDNDSAGNWLLLMQAGREANHAEKWAICVLANWFPPEWSARVHRSEVITMDALEEAARGTEWDNWEQPESDPSYLGYLEDDFDSDSGENTGIGVTAVAVTHLYSRLAEKLRDELQDFYYKNQKKLVAAAIEHYNLKQRKKEQLN